LVCNSGLLDLLVSIAEAQQHKSSATAATLVLRNLAHAQEAGPYFLASAGCLDCLVACLHNAPDNPDSAALAASALWAVVHRCEKVCACHFTAAVWQGSLSCLCMQCTLCVSTHTDMTAIVDDPVTFCG
jgi:hypothetical protein